MAKTISNISELVTETAKQEAKVLSYSEELTKIAKAKFHLSILYFAGVVILMTTLFL